MAKKKVDEVVEIDQVKNCAWENICKYKYQCCALCKVTKCEDRCKHNPKKCNYFFGDKKLLSKTSEKDSEVNPTTKSKMKKKELW